MWWKHCYNDISNLGSSTHLARGKQIPTCDQVYPIVDVSHRSRFKFWYRLYEYDRGSQEEEALRTKH